MAAPDLARLRLELGTLLGDLYVDAESLRRIAAQAKVPPGDVADHPKSRDRWHALLARLDQVGLGLILDAVGEEYSRKLGDRFAPLRAAHPDVEGTASVEVELSWGRGAEDRGVWRVLPRAKNAAAQATVRVVTDSSGSPSVPTLVALEGPLLSGRLTPMKELALSPVELGPGLGMWTASIVTSHPGWRTRRIEATATAGGDTGSARLVSISRSGMVLAVLAIMAALGFVVAWLFPLGLPTAVAGSVGVAIGTAVLGVVAPLLLDRVRAGAIPLVLGFDLAVPLAAVVVALAVLVPPWTCVIVENESGGHETVWRGADLRGGAACLCPADGAACGCDPAARTIRRVPVVTRRARAVPRPRRHLRFAASPQAYEIDIRSLDVSRSISSANAIDLEVDSAEDPLTMRFPGSGELKCGTHGIGAGDDFDIRPVHLSGNRDGLKKLAVVDEPGGMESRWVVRSRDGGEQPRIAWWCANAGTVKINDLFTVVCRDGGPRELLFVSMSEPSDGDALIASSAAGEVTLRVMGRSAAVICDPPPVPADLTIGDRSARLEANRLVWRPKPPPPSPRTCIYYPLGRNGDGRVRYGTSEKAIPPGTVPLHDPDLIEETKNALGNCRPSIRCAPPDECER